MLSPEIMTNVKQLQKDPTVATRPVIHTSSPLLGKDYWHTPSHQDQASVQQSLNTLICWVPLVDCGYSDIGPLLVQPGSHLKGSQYESYGNGYFGVVENDFEFTPVYMNKSDMLIFNSSLVHESGINDSRKIRWSISLRYTDLESKDWQKRQLYSPYVYKPTIDANYKYSAEEVKEALNG